MDTDVSPSILREIPVDLGDNLDLLEPFNKAFSRQNKDVRRLYISVVCSVGRFLLISNSKKPVF